MSNKTDRTAEKKIYFEGELMSPRDWRDKYIHENNIANGVPFGLYDGNLMEKYAKYYFWHNSNDIAKEVEKLPHIEELIFEEEVKDDGSFSGKKRRAVLVELPKILKIITRETT